MSSQIYWCVVSKRTWGKQKMWPMTFYKTRHEAHMDAWHRNKSEEKLRFKREWYDKRVLLETKDAIHYDVYEHEFKRLKK